MNKKGEVFSLTFLAIAGVVGLLVIAGTISNKSLNKRLVKECVDGGKSKDGCVSDVAKLSYRNKLLSIQK